MDDREQRIAETRRIVDQYKTTQGALIPCLQHLQNTFGYLPAEALETASRELSIPLAEIYGVATFYAQFHLSPRGRHIIRICRGTACHVRGSATLLETLKETLHVEENGTTEDRRFTLEPVACLGACGLAPVITVDRKTYGRLGADDLPGILEQYP
ncbi:MAG: NADH-quinone oxidoreductase subunit NuoE [Synergistales bacterium]|nr:NADH-quinone oxidoreductase subunit NuoE [Synergistales bacterium]